jgi:hypothetical protein
MTMNLSRKSSISIAAAAIATIAVIGSYAIYRGMSTGSAPNKPVERKVVRVKKVESEAKPSWNGEAPPASVDLNSVPQMPGNLPSKEELREQFRLLKTILELPPERLAKIRTSIEKIEAMPAEQKARMLSMIRDNDGKANIAARQAHAEELLTTLPPDMRALIEFRTKSFTKERRAAFIEGYAAACEDTLKASLRNNSSQK